MHMRRTAVLIACFSLGACARDGSLRTNRTSETDRNGKIAASEAGVRTSATQPLVIGHSFTIDSRVMGEVRRMNVFVPTTYGQKIDAPMPVLYMLDGGLDEDFLHVAGLLQVLVSNG